MAQPVVVYSHTTIQDADHAAANDRSIPHVLRASVSHAALTNYAALCRSTFDVHHHPFDVYLLFDVDHQDGDNKPWMVEYDPRMDGYIVPDRLNHPPLFDSTCLAPLDAVLVPATTDRHMYYINLFFLRRYYSTDQAVALKRLKKCTKYARKHAKRVRVRAHETAESKSTASFEPDVDLNSSRSADIHATSESVLNTRMAKDYEMRADSLYVAWAAFVASLSEAPLVWFAQLRELELAFKGSTLEGLKCSIHQQSRREHVPCAVKLDMKCPLCPVGAGRMAKDQYKACLRRNTTDLDKLLHQLETRTTTRAPPMRCRKFAKVSKYLRFQATTHSASSSDDSGDEMTSTAMPFNVRKVCIVGQDGRRDVVKVPARPLTPLELKSIGVWQDLYHKFQAQVADATKSLRVGEYEEESKQSEPQTPHQIIKFSGSSIQLLDGNDDNNAHEDVDVEEPDVGVDEPDPEDPLTQHQPAGEVLAETRPPTLTVSVHKSNASLNDASTQPQSYSIEDTIQDQAEPIVFDAVQLQPDMRDLVTKAMQAESLRRLELERQVISLSSQVATMSSMLCSMQGTINRLETERLKR